MNKVNEKSTLNVKLIVKPILFTTYHTHAYIGPCRYDEGHALTTKPDMEVTQKEFDTFREEVEEEAGLHNVEFLEPVAIFRNRNFTLKGGQIRKAPRDDAETDFHLIRGLGISSYFAVELLKRIDKPIGYTPSKSTILKYNHVDMTTHLFAEGKPGCISLDFEEINHIFAALKIEKVLAYTKMFFPLRSAMLTFGCQSSYPNLEDITRRFKVRFSHVNSDEVSRWLDALTDEKKAKTRALVDKLEEESQGVHMPAEYILNGMESCETIRRMMTYCDCNVFTISCFEVCATRELNRRRLTLRLAHSLFRDEGIVSACTGDVGPVLAITILINIARKAPYMRNATMLDRNIDQYRTPRDVACAQIKDYDGPALPTKFTPFTVDSWGTTMRYDFSKGNGGTLTTINMNPDMRKIMVARGTTNGRDDYLTPECKHAMYYTVKDTKQFHEYQKLVGHYFVLVYGDYVKETKAFTKEYGLEILEA